MYQKRPAAAFINDNRPNFLYSGRAFPLRNYKRYDETILFQEFHYARPEPTGMNIIIMRVHLRANDKIIVGASFVCDCDAVPRGDKSYGLIDFCVHQSTRCSSTAIYVRGCFRKGKCNNSFPVRSVSQFPLHGQGVTRLVQVYSHSAD